MGRINVKRGRGWGRISAVKRDFGHLVLHWARRAQHFVDPDKPRRDVDVVEAMRGLRARAQGLVDEVRPLVVGHIGCDPVIQTDQVASLSGHARQVNK